ncbi:MAG: type IV secretion system DNA-binding domain-containing protein [Pseudomonadota bacterium]|nr:type IV secretion system DNA-binding domain-containing protein [Pseudomonadota bacterium]
MSTIYGPGPARTIVENCSNTLVLRCSASKGGGTAQFASALIGKREVVRQTVSTNTEAHRVLSDTVRGYSCYGEQHQVEDAVMASEIEALRTGPGS